MKRFLRTVMAVVLLTAMLPVTAYAGGPLDGKVVLGSTFVLEAGDTLNGDLAVIGGTATLEAGSTVTGDVFVMGGNVEANGLIEGDMAVMGGNVRMGPQAILRGDLISFGGNVDRGSARIEGQIVTENEFTFPQGFELGRLNVPWRFNSGIVFSPQARVLGYLFQSVMLAALALLVVMFWPDATKRVAETMVSQPVLAGGLGVLTGIVVPVLAVLLIITICLALVGVVGLVLFVAAGVFGWIALGLEVGKRLGNAINQDLNPVFAAGLGTLVFSLVVNGIGFIPCIGWLAPLLAGAIGLGAVLMTRFGTRPYPFEVVEVPATTGEDAEKPKRKPRAKKTS